MEDQREKLQDIWNADPFNSNLSKELFENNVEANLSFLLTYVFTYDSISIGIGQRQLNDTISDDIWENEDLLNDLKEDCTEDEWKELTATEGRALLTFDEYHQTNKSLTLMYCKGMGFTLELEYWDENEDYHNYEVQLKDGLLLHVPRGLQIAMKKVAETEESTTLDSKSLKN